jgi:hypothetical protein
MCGINNNGLPLPVTFIWYTFDCENTDAVVSVRSIIKSPVKFFILFFLPLDTNSSGLLQNPKYFFKDHPHKPRQPADLTYISFDFNRVTT